jgi:predicted nucleotide-binding protein
MGLLNRDRVCCLYAGDIELPSDMDGIVYVPFKDSVNEAREKIRRELISAGFELTS